eukprot:2030312-Prymnesium_polylepis.1
MPQSRARRGKQESSRWPPRRLTTSGSARGTVRPSARSQRGPARAHHRPWRRMSLSAGHSLAVRAHELPATRTTRAIRQHRSAHRHSTCPTAACR